MIQKEAEKIISEEITKKNELRNVDDSLIKEQLDIYYKKNPKTIKLLEELTEAKLLKNKDVKELVKHIRSWFRKQYGMFKTKHSTKTDRYIEKLKEAIDNSDTKKKDYWIEKLLKSHTSTRERLPHYEEFYSKLFEITGKPKKIADLGCGLNPIAITLTNVKLEKYFASELTTKDCKQLGKFFQVMKIPFHTEPADVSKAEIIVPEEYDITLLLKLVDVIEAKNRNITRSVIENIKSKWIVISFATKSLSGKIIYSNREWIERVLEGYTYETISVENELFYVVKNKL